jgi:hypothetical protein
MLSQELENEFNECDVLMRQMASFAGNFIDVDRLLSVSSQYGDLQRQMEFLEQDYSRQKEEFQMLQAQNYVQISRMNEGLKKLQSEKSDLEYERNNRDITISTLSRDFKLKEQKYANEINELEGRIKILEDAKREIQNGLKVAQQHSASTTKVMVNASSAAKPSSTSISTSAGAPKEASFVDKKPPLLNGGATPMKISATPAPPPPNLPNGTAKFVASSNIPPAPPLPSPRSSVEPSTPKATTSTGGPGPPPPPPPPSLFFKV